MQNKNNNGSNYPPQIAAAIVFCTFFHFHIANFFKFMTAYLSFTHFVLCSVYSASHVSLLHLQRHTLSFPVVSYTALCTLRSYHSLHCLCVVLSLDSSHRYSSCFYFCILFIRCGWLWHSGAFCIPNR